MKILTRIIISLALIFQLSGCDSLHKKSDPRRVLRLCEKEADVNYRNRNVSENAEKLYRKAIKACDKKFKACLTNPGSQTCKNFSLRYLMEYSRL